MTFFTGSSLPLTAAELEFLEQTLLKYGNDDSVLDASELDGLLTAIVSGPNVIPPSVWFPELWGGSDNEPEWESEEEFQRFMGLIMQNLNSIADVLIEDPKGFQALFNQREFEGEVFIIADEWCEGYMRGVSLVEESWAQTPQELLMEHMSAINMFAGEFDAQLAKLSDPAIKKLQNKIEPAARALHAYWLQKRSPSSASKTTPVRTGVKVGRNEPCPCGSGKKFKHCCLH